MSHVVTLHEYQAYAEGWWNANTASHQSDKSMEQKTLMKAEFIAWCDENDCTYAPGVRAIIEAD